MNAGLGRKGRFAMGGVTFAISVWLGAPWLFCSETWAHEAPTECTGASITADAKLSPRQAAPPLAPFLL
jgi:hypothetical protein